MIRWTPRTQQTRTRGFINAFRFSLPRRPLLPSSIARGCVLARSLLLLLLLRSVPVVCLFLGRSLPALSIGQLAVWGRDHLLLLFVFFHLYTILKTSQHVPRGRTLPWPVLLSVCLSICRLCFALVSKPVNQSTRRRPLRFAGAGSAASRDCAAPMLLLVLAYTITLMMITLMMIDTTARPSSRGERHGTHRYTIYPCHTTHADKTISLASYIITHPT